MFSKAEEATHHTLFFIRAHFIRTSKLRLGKKMRTN